MKRLLRKFYHYYLYDMKLSYRLMVSYWLLLAVPTIAVSLLIYGQIYQIIVADTIRSEQQLAQQTVNTMEATLRQISNTAGTISSDSYLTYLFESEHHPITEQLAFSNQTASFLKSVDHTVDGNLIQHIQLYMDESYEKLYDHPDLNSPKTVMHSMDQARGTYWYGILSSTAYKVLYCPSFYLSPTEISTLGDMALMERLTYGDNPDSTAAYLAIYFNQKTFDQILAQNISINDSVSYIINQRSSLVASSDKTLSGTYFMNYETICDSLESPGTFTTKYVLDNKVYASYYPIAGTDWLLVSVIPADPLMQKGNALIMRFVSFYLMFLGVAFIAAIISSRSITRRILQIIRHMRTARAGKLVPLKVEKGADEIGDLVDTYNYMTDQINNLMESQILAAVQLRTAEFDALQAQINPHFLYNTLDMINWLAKSGQSDEVPDVVQTLSKFYKLTLSKKDSINTIEQELTHVSLYMHLQSRRYQGNIDFLVDVPDEIMDYQIPKLSFQPIVENCIQHGILEKEDKSGTIVITAWTEGEDIVFQISDDGMGMDGDALASILKGTGSSRSGSNIGIYNTHQRLQLLYGEDYGLTYASVLGQGTEVTMRLPGIR